MRVPAPLRAAAPPRPHRPRDRRDTREILHEVGLDEVLVHSLASG